MHEHNSSIMPADDRSFALRRPQRRRIGTTVAVSFFLATVFGILVLVALLLDIIVQAAPWLDGAFLTNRASRLPERAGIRSAILGSLWLMGLTALISVPLGIASAVYLEEYSREGLFVKIVQVNIANLAGVPSVIYGILGLAIFVRFISLGSSLLAGALTLGLLILPIIIISTQEALRGVPDDLRKAAYALGGTRWQVIWNHVLPAAAPGILTGVILALSRAIGETAPLIMVGAAGLAAAPRGLIDPFTALPIQIFNWTARPQDEFRGLAAAAIVVLMVLLLTMNLTAILLRKRYETQHAGG